MSVSAIPKSAASALNKHERHHLWTIHRRILFLEQRIALANGSRDFDRAELAALWWVLERADVPEPVGEGRRGSRATRG